MGGIISKIAVFALFIGVLSSMSLGIIRIVADPLNPEPWGDFIIDTAKVFTNSQNTISESINEFDGADSGYQSYLFWRIIGSSMITVVILWIIHKALKFLIPGEKTDLGTKLILILLALLLVWMIGLAASILSGEGVPSFLGFYNGWIELIVNRGIFLDYLIERIQT